MTARPRPPTRLRPCRCRCGSGGRARPGCASSAGRPGRPYRSGSRPAAAARTARLDSTDNVLRRGPAAKVRAGGNAMISPSQPEHLNNRHRDTLRQIFAHPVSHNVEWRAVLSLLEAVGTVTVRQGETRGAGPGARAARWRARSPPLLTAGERIKTGEQTGAQALGPTRPE